jgi:hypothetical protein
MAWACAADFQAAQRAHAAARVPDAGLAAGPGGAQAVRLEPASFASERAQFVDGALVLQPGAWAMTTAVFDRPLRVDVAARMSARAGHAAGAAGMDFFVFPQRRVFQLGLWSGFANGLVFGAGWWQSALGAGGTAGPACVRNASAAVDRILVQLATIHDRSRCLENVGLGGLTVAACSSSPLQLWVRRNFLCLRASPALFKWRVV